MWRRALGLLFVSVSWGCSGGADPVLDVGPATSAVTTVSTSIAETTTTVAADSPGSPGCGGPAAEVGDSEQFFSTGGVERRYLQTVPDAHDGDTPVPLVVDLHGYSQGAEFHAAETALGSYGAEQGFVTITPHGGGPIPSWDFAPVDNADIATISDLLAEVGRELCVDPSRTFVTGFSNGAILATYLACDPESPFAAAALVGGVVDPETCEPGHSVPAIVFHGAEDPFMPIDGGAGPVVLTFPTDDGGTMRDVIENDDPNLRPPIDDPVPARVAAWADRNGCSGETNEAVVAESVRRVAHDCPVGGEVVLYVVDDGGHSWPGSALTAEVDTILGPTTRAIDANELMWEFFQRFSR